MFDFFYSQLLTEEEKDAIFEACDIAVDLNNYKIKIFEYVESRMALIAPNLSIIVGSSTAAKIMGKNFILFIFYYYLFTFKKILKFHYILLKKKKKFLS